MAAQTIVLRPRGEASVFEPEAAFILDGVSRRILFRESATIAFERCAPARTFISWPVKRNYSGSYWSSTMRGHIGFESLYERAALMTLDRDPTVVGVSSQPMWIRWPDGCTPRSHAPDFFARHGNGDGEIIDVRPRRLIDDEAAVVFEATRRLCSDAGFLYRVYCELKGDLDRNLKFLSRFRHESWAPAADQFGALEGRAGQVTVRELATELADGGTLSRGLGCVYWLIWHNILYVDLDRRLALHSRLSFSKNAA